MGWSHCICVDIFSFVTCHSVDQFAYNSLRTLHSARTDVCRRVNEFVGIFNLT